MLITTAQIETRWPEDDFVRRIEKKRNANGESVYITPINAIGTIMRRSSAIGDFPVMRFRKIKNEWINNNVLEWWKKMAEPKEHRPMSYWQIQSALADYAPELLEPFADKFERLPTGDNAAKISKALFDKADFWKTINKQVGRFLWDAAETIRKGIDR